MIFEFLWMAFGYVLKALDTSMVIFSHRSVKGAYLDGDIVVSQGEISTFTIIQQCIGV
jgi:hypothetical protein